MAKPNAATRIAEHVNQARFVHYSEQWGLLYVWRGANEIVVLSVWTGQSIDVIDSDGTAESAQRMIFDHECSRFLWHYVMKGTIPCPPPEEH